MSSKFPFSINGWLSSALNELPYLWKRVNRKYHWLLRGGTLVALYAAWLALFRLVSLSFITFFLLPSSTIAKRFGANPTQIVDPLPRFEDVSEVFAANELTLVGFAALFFVLLLRWTHPLSRTQTSDIVSSARLKIHFFPGALHGSILAFGVAIAFLLSGLYRFLGFVLQFEDSSFAIPNLLIRITAIATFVYCEEFLFRQKITGYFKEGFIPTYFNKEDAESEKTRGEILAGLLIALLYCFIKSLQFDLGWMHLLTLFLVSLALTLRTFVEEDFVHGAGYWTALLVVFHAGFSLPIFGNEFSGILLFKYQSALTDVAAQSESSRFLTGGQGGPLAGFAFQILLLIDVGRNALRYFQKKSLLR